MVVKVMPGVYKEGKTINIPSNLSLSGSGPDRTSLIGTDPTKPVVLVQSEENSLLAGFRIIPAGKQSMKAPTVIVSKSKAVTLLGNVVETRGGVGVWALQSSNVRLNGNAFPSAGTAGSRAISCDHSGIRAEANAFVGDWSIAIMVDKGCSADLNRTVFISNQTSVLIGPGATSLKMARSSFVRDTAGVKLEGKIPHLEMSDNLYYECADGLIVAGDIETRKLGRAAVWKTRMTGQGKNLSSLDLVRTEPRFRSPENYDFRLLPGQAQLSTGDSGVDLGAFQQDTYLGIFTQQLARALAVATGQADLAAQWGISP